MSGPWREAPCWEWAAGPKACTLDAVTLQLGWITPLSFSPCFCVSQDLSSQVARLWQGCCHLTTALGFASGKRAGLLINYRIMTPSSPASHQSPTKQGPSHGAQKHEEGGFLIRYQHPFTTTIVYIFLMENLRSSGRRSRWNPEAGKDLRPSAQRAILDPHLPLCLQVMGDRLLWASSHHQSMP